MPSSKISAYSAAQLTLQARSRVLNPIIDAITRKAGNGGTSVKTASYKANDNIDNIFQAAICPILRKDGFRLNETDLGNGQKQLEISWEHMLEMQDIELPELRDQEVVDMEESTETPTKLESPITQQSHTEVVETKHEEPEPEPVKVNDPHASESANVAPSPVEPTPVPEKDDSLDQQNGFNQSNNSVFEPFNPPVDNPQSAPQQTSQQWRLGDATAPNSLWGQPSSGKPMVGAFQVLPPQSVHQQQV